MTEKFIWRPEDVEVRPINLADCTATLPCRPHGEACRPLWAELEDARVEQLLEERHFDVGQDNYPLWFTDPDR